ncbi:limonene-1,2-epoxide hydrolase family protein [Burkholderia orbicola]|uniref:limonene-1,2-epoxide hydrolase family protein n=1 Tax=Burkholderia orbicola TaxID=2978683 RepID=UPI0039A4311B
MTNQEIVRAYIGAFEARDMDRIIAMTAPDIVYHNIPMEIVRGREAFKEVQAPFIGRCEEIRWEILRLAEAEDGAVLTERVDHFFMTRNRRISVRVMGIFELRDGLVAAWRDYFDLAEFNAQSAKSVGSAPVTPSRK